MIDRHTAGHLISKGFVLGVVHVLSGPDHMTALAAMTAGEPWYR